MRAGRQCYTIGIQVVFQQCGTPCTGVLATSNLPRRTGVLPATSDSCSVLHISVRTCSYEHDKLHHRLLGCGIQAQGPLHAAVLNETECDINTALGEHWVGRNVYKWFLGNELE